LSPLFISVHATDPMLRLKMLGIKKATPIMDQLLLLKDNGISFHTQIVVCPGYNDGAELTRTVQSLFSIGKNLLSIAVVPVGLTRFRTFPLDAVSPEKAREIFWNISALSDRDVARNGIRRLFLADEFFLKAGAPIPAVGITKRIPRLKTASASCDSFLKSGKLRPERSNAKTARKCSAAPGKKVSSGDLYGGIIRT